MMTMAVRCSSSLEEADASVHVVERMNDSYFDHHHLLGLNKFINRKANAIHYRLLFIKLSIRSRRERRGTKTI